MGAALKIKKASVPRQPGEVARLKVVRGPDYGTVFVLTGPRVTVGRGEENDVMVSDLKTSRVHAEVSRSADGWAVKDMGSANGILCNGKAVKTAKLNTTSTITLGETTLEFITADVGTQMLVAPAKTPLQVQVDESAFKAQQNKVRGLGKAGAASKPGPLQNPKILLGLGAAAVFAMFLGGEEDAPKKPARNPGAATVTDPLAGFAQPDSPGAVKSADMFFRAGFREYRERNYIRARVNFETVLQISPGHRMAKRYLDNCNKQIDDEVKNHLDVGKKDLEAGKLHDAKGNFEAVLRLLHRDQANDNYKEARDQLDLVNKKAQEDNSG